MKQGKNNASGVTLIEMMVTLALLAMLVGLGLPQIQGFISRQGVVNEGNRLLSDIRFARVEAARRGADVRVCGFNTNTDCDGSPACSCFTNRRYERGWIVFVDANDDGSMATSDGDELLRVGAHSSRDNLQMRGSNLARGGFKFDQTGALHGDDFDASNNGVAVVICEDSQSTAKVPGRALFVRPAGNLVTQKLGDGASCSVNAP